MHQDFTQQAETVAKAIILTSYTKAKASIRARLLKEYLEAYFFDRRYKDNPAMIADYIIQANELSLTDDQVFVKNIHSAYLSFFDKKSFYDLLSAVKNEIFRSPRLTLYISTALDEDAIKRIGDWCRTNIKPDLLLNIRYTSDISAGCGINWEMHYYELSFETLFEEQKGAVSALLTKYAAT